MAKKTIQRFLPDHNKVKEHKYLRIFGRLLHDANLWHLNRRSARGAFAVGLFFAFIPVPFQMVLAAALAIPFRVNLPISVATVWITNPLTMPPIFYCSYIVGTIALSQPQQHFQFEPSWQWFIDSLTTIDFSLFSWLTYMCYCCCYHRLFCYRHALETLSPKSMDTSP